MSRQLSPEVTMELTPAERAVRRNRVMNMMASITNDADHRRQVFRSKVAGQLTALVSQAETSAAKIAKKLGVSRSQLSRQLSGDANLTLNTIHDIAIAIGANVSIRLELPVTQTPGMAPRMPKSGEASVRNHCQGIFEDLEVFRCLPSGSQALSLRLPAAHWESKTESRFHIEKSERASQFDAANESSGSKVRVQIVEVA